MVSDKSSPNSSNVQTHWLSKNSFPLANALSTGHTEAARWVSLRHTAMGFGARTQGVRPPSSNATNRRTPPSCKRDARLEVKKGVPRHQRAARHREFDAQRTEISGIFRSEWLASAPSWYIESTVLLTGVTDAWKIYRGRRNDYF